MPCPDNQTNVLSAEKKLPAGPSVPYYADETVVLSAVRRLPAGPSAAAAMDATPAERTLPVGLSVPGCTDKADASLVGDFLLRASRGSWRIRVHLSAMVKRAGHRGAAGRVTIRGDECGDCVEALTSALLKLHRTLL